MSTEPLNAYREIAAGFRSERSSRLTNTRINPADFDALSDGGFLSLSVPQELGGDWVSLIETGPQFAEIVRTIARGDPSVALVAAMHPAVVSYWQHSAEHNPANTLSEQAKEIYAGVLGGHWWGTLMSEPGSGGDIAKTKTLARPTGTADDAFELSGEKHFGSGSGQTSFMVTTAREADGEQAIDLFVIDMRELAWDGTSGLTLLREWDGHGMCGTQSHAFTLNNCPAHKADANKRFANALPQVSQMSGVQFCAVILGILDEAFDSALTKLKQKADGMRALERVELVRAQNAYWQAQTLYTSVRDQMGTPVALGNARQAKYAIAAHAENALAGLSKVVGGSSFSRTSPLGQWGQDVKALGFLRPPWALQNDQLFSALWED